MTESQVRPRDHGRLGDVTKWLKENNIEEVECVVPDIAGVGRGKVMPAYKFAQLKPTHLPVSIFWQTITGDYADFGDEEAYTEADTLLVPDLSTLRLVPWASSPTAQVIHDVIWNEGGPVEYAPREVLKRVLSYYAKEGWQPVVAPELEFYLTKPNPDPDYPLEPPVGRSGRQGAGRQSYSISAVDEYDKFVDDMYDFAEAQELAIDTIIQEAGASQLEINLLHGEPLELADQTFLFKRTIREAAIKHGYYATFMAKPMENQPGSAAHIHQSVVEVANGRNIFTDSERRPTEHFYQFLAGQQTYLGAATCLMAPYVNSYRRLVPDDAAPINLEWGIDNRSTGLRIPVSSPEARRVENRVCGADTNPYLAIAASLACGYLGIKERLQPREVCAGNAYKNRHDLPAGLLEGLAAFEACEPLQELLGVDFSRLYLAVKREEFSAFMRVISPWEREHLLLAV
ncbi:MAG: glutamine synthetase [Rhizobiales bacterium]|nr:glutamine synthetase [Hyphomicrobiales bacterium]